MAKTIVVLCGGQSTEHEIALRSARTVINELDKKKYEVVAYYVDKAGRFLSLGRRDHVDRPEDLMVKSEASVLSTIEAFARDMDRLEDVMVFPVIHGQSGEDGQVQGFLQMLGLPYVGNGIMASALCMDKGFTNQVLADLGIPEAKYIIVEKKGLDRKILMDRVEKELGFPCFIKPCNNGSSVGVTKASRENFDRALDEAFAYDHKILVEEMIRGHELEVSVLGNAEAEASKPGSYTTTREVLDYEAKYLDRTLVENIPHPLSEEKTREIQDLALRTYHALGCEGLARVDIFYGEDGCFYVNEVNTLPGMTPTSLAPKMWTALTDMTFSDYLDAIIRFGEESYANRQALTYSWE